VDAQRQARLERLCAVREGVPPAGHQAERSFDDE
jgi:hypothetical protein